MDTSKLQIYIWTKNIHKNKIYIKALKFFIFAGFIIYVCICVCMYVYI